MRTVPGQNFTFDWTMNLGSSAMHADAAYPGNDVVDIVGVDAYDWKWGDAAITPAARWNWILRQTYGLNWVASFAAAHGKRISVPEWGLAVHSLMQGGGGGDDPNYVRSMLGWTAAHHTVYQAYYDEQDCRISNNQFPTSTSAYRSLLAPQAAPVAPVAAPDRPDPAGAEAPPPHGPRQSQLSALRWNRLAR